jgi:hypothetical protein
MPGPFAAFGQGDKVAAWAELEASWLHIALRCAIILAAY